MGWAQFQTINEGHVDEWRTSSTCLATAAAPAGVRRRQCLNHRWVLEVDTYMGNHGNMFNLFKSNYFWRVDMFHQYDFLISLMSKIYLNNLSYLKAQNLNILEMIWFQEPTVQSLRPQPEPQTLQGQWSYSCGCPKPCPQCIGRQQLWPIFSSSVIMSSHVHISDISDIRRLH